MFFQVDSHYTPIEPGIHSESERESDKVLFLSRLLCKEKRNGNDNIFTRANEEKKVIITIKGVNQTYKEGIVKEIEKFFILTQKRKVIEKGAHFHLNEHR